jgi:hypothetical protein
MSHSEHSINEEQPLTVSASLAHFCSDAASSTAARKTSTSAGYSERMRVYGSAARSFPRSECSCLASLAKMRELSLSDIASVQDFVRVLRVA